MSFLDFTNTGKPLLDTVLSTICPLFMYLSSHFKGTCIMKYTSIVSSRTYPHISQVLNSTSRRRTSNISSIKFAIFNSAYFNNAVFSSQPSSRRTLHTRFLEPSYILLQSDEALPSMLPFCTYPCLHPKLVSTSCNTVFRIDAN